VSGQVSNPLMTQPLGNSYDEIPYPGSPFPQTHPDRLATIGVLFGMTPAPVERCRVLELGCTDGGNLIPMAVALPESEFVGVDLSGRQIEQGRQVVETLQLGNVRLEHLDILDVGPQYGRFDYLIAHGVFSWVPAAVQERIFAIARELLNPQGIAYVSYNTYPGWHLRGMLRDMMLYHTRQFSGTQMRIDQARALVNFLASAVPSRDSPYGLLLTSELSSMQNWADSYIFHESLEAHNDPIYFYQFAERAAKHDLRYLGEANFSAMLAEDFPSEVAATLTEIGRDIIEMEQYMDFVRNRMFRQTLLCHAETALDRTLTAACCEKMHIRSHLQPVSLPVDVHNTAPADFQSPGGAIVTARTPLQKAALLALTQAAPAPIAFGELLRRARALSQRQRFEVHEAAELDSGVEDLRDAIFKCFCDNLMEFHVSPPPMVLKPSQRPVASPLARLQARPGGYATTLAHEQVMLDVVNAHLLRRLDGSRDRAALLQELDELASNGTIVATQNGQVIEERDTVASVLQEQLESRLQELASCGLLMA
jgi:methyltransferase-like protein/cyclopropane fatty-acyl-phospholipid synthase-like methyltransferase